MSHVEFEVAAVSSVSDVLKQGVLPARMNCIHAGLPRLRFALHLNGSSSNTFAFPNESIQRPAQTTASCRNPLSSRALQSVSLPFPLVSCTETTYAVNLRSGGKRAGAGSVPVLCPRTSQASINVGLGEYSCTGRTINSSKCPESISGCDGLRGAREVRGAVRNDVRGWAGRGAGWGGEQKAGPGGATLLVTPPPPALFRVR